MNVWGSEVASVNRKVYASGVSHTSCTRFTIFLDKFTESGPGKIAADEVHCLILTRMSGEDVVMLVAENLEPEVVGIGDIYEKRNLSGVTDQQGFGSLRWAM